MAIEKNLLNGINSPNDLKKLKIEELVQVSKELRQFIIDVVSCNPGHFGASLGVVELTVALHYVYNTPFDKIIWDVGHQAYGHKILTGRRDNFHTNRKYKGISGFPNMSESEYDAFGVGHSSTSISAALGIATADKHSGIKRNVAAVIGDGSLTGGMAFEGLNNAGWSNTNLVVILNDNNMAIDPNVGAMKEYLVDITTSKTYNKVKNDMWKILGKINKIAPHTRDYAQKLENGLKSLLLKQSNLFESLNFRYFGPIDGHDVVHIARLLEDFQTIPGPKLLHILTKKGKGFKQAEENQTIFHAPGKFDKETGELIIVDSEKPKTPLFQEVFGHTILELARKNEKIIGITPAMPTGCSLKIMMDELPDRTFDVGIAEQHAVTFAAGMATQGLIPFCNIYSSFAQRAYDQIIHDVALQKLPVVFCFDRAGLVGADGPTHHGVFDLAFMRSVPNLVVSAPMDEKELRNMMFTAQLGKYGPFSIRYPRGRGDLIDWKNEMEEIIPGTSRQLSKGDDFAILSIGHIGQFASEAVKELKKQQIDAAHYDMRFVKPLDEQQLHAIFKKHQYILTIEDGTVKGGFGSAVLEFMAENDYLSHVKILGIPDKFIEHGTQKELWHDCKIDTDGILNATKQLLNTKILSKVI
ncbi:MAG: 1-deoxy-D-xylulose-5-phosphate synthase [Bacteroidales bacterium]|nr:1-deoxy-D-xylulose-5-phosphate synthase [Bacteroidales bacterium]MBN2820082.1 1-deoxy-D-xylulose-5-phosphate synthase [Bacteroidales bacterium]